MVLGRDFANDGTDWRRGGERKGSLKNQLGKFEGGAPDSLPYKPDVRGGLGHARRLRPRRRGREGGKVLGKKRKSAQPQRSR